MPSKRWRLACAAVVAVASAATVFARSASFGPRLEVDVHPYVRAARGQAYELHIRARGGETIDAVWVEPIVGVELIGSTRVRDLPPDGVFIARVLAPSDAARGHTLRVVQDGRVRAEYEIELEPAGP